MSATVRDRREQLEQRLIKALLRAEKKINQATPENQQEVLRCYGEALSVPSFGGTRRGVAGAR